MMTQEFFNPDSRFRSAPFWAWNGTLQKERLEREIEVFRRMGFGGFHIHARTGLATPYLSDEFMNLVRFCAEEAKQKQMFAYLYDEDRYSSGQSGGLCRKPEYCRRYLRFSPDSDIAVEPKDTAVHNGTHYLLACYDIACDELGRIVSYRKIEADESAVHRKWYAHCIAYQPHPWYNNTPKADLLSVEGTQAFIQLTCDAYRKACGDLYTVTSPSIFTDEPALHDFHPIGDFKNGAGAIIDGGLPASLRTPESGEGSWSIDLPESYHADTGEDLLMNLPEIFMEWSDGRLPRTRYLYFRHLAKRFRETYTAAFASRCHADGLKLTGHYRSEDTLLSGTRYNADLLPLYADMDIPGMDLLADSFAPVTAKQCQSAVRQYGRSGMMCELYGVTHYDFDFRGYKRQGDWLAALGVTLRVPHLSYYTMEGTAKRDYPPSFQMQSPWAEDFTILENHYARLNVMLTKGKAVCHTAVLSPADSMMLTFGPEDLCGQSCRGMSKRHQKLGELLVRHQVDFDYISEALLPEQSDVQVSDTLCVGQMRYDTVILQDCVMLRKTTFDRLKAFTEGGGKVILLGEIPRYLDLHTDESFTEWVNSLPVSPDRESLAVSLRENEPVTVSHIDGSLTNDKIMQLRQSDDGKILYIAHFHTDTDSGEPEAIRICVKEKVRPILLDTMNGKMMPIHAKSDETHTEWTMDFYANDDALILLSPDMTEVSETSETVEASETSETVKASETSVAVEASETSVAVETSEAVQTADTTKMSETVEASGTIGQSIPLVLPSQMKYTLHEPNVLLLDMAEYALDSGTFEAKTELLKADNRCREKLGMPLRTALSAQPWVIPDTKPEHRITLRYQIQSEMETDVRLALERAEQAEIWLNGRRIPNETDGYFTDESIRCISLGNIRRGNNILTVRLPMTRRAGLEWCYLLGNFGVDMVGSECRLVAMPDRLTFGSITEQKLPFYSHSVTYHIPIHLDRDGSLTVKIAKYRGALVHVAIDGNPCEPIIFAPFISRIGGITAGEHDLTLTLVGNRANCFSPLHNAAEPKRLSPGCWYPSEKDYTDEYRLRPMGIFDVEVRRGETF